MPQVPPDAPRRVPLVVMGVSGAGKSTVGAALAAALGRPFLDADDLHSGANRDRMARGIPLAERDRAPWLRAVGAAVAARSAEGDPPVVACSALTRRSRDLLRARAPGLAFAYLAGDGGTVAGRLSTREHAFMPASLMGSQFDALEPPTGEARVLTLDLRAPVPRLVREAAAWLRALEAGSLAGPGPASRPQT